MPQFTTTSTADEVAACLSSQIAGKTILITGVSPGGLGAEMALSLAPYKPTLLILASRNASKIEETSKAIESKAPGTPIKTLKLDLSDLSAVRTAAAEILATGKTIDVIVNNAAIMANPYTLTKDGFESQFATNHLGHFLFTNLIIGKLAKGGRVVNVSSMAYTFSGVRFGDLNFSDGKEYDGWKAYGQSKSANISYTVELARRGVASFCLHPGGIFTNLMQNLDKEVSDALKIKHAGQFKDIQQGTATHMVAAFDPDIVAQSGAYLEDCNITKPTGDVDDPEVAKKLWAVSEEMVGEKFDI